MPRRTKAAIAAGQPASADPTEFVGRSSKGSVRPADDRYITDAELDERDRYVLAVTGPDAQQLVAKRQGLRSVLEQLSDEQLAAYMPQGFEGGREQLLDRMAESATEMPWASYRELVDGITAKLEQEHDDLPEPPAA